MMGYPLFDIASENDFRNTSMESGTLISGQNFQDPSESFV